MKNILLFGAPGAGKGTQADILRRKYNLAHISTGDIFRYHIKQKTELGKLAKSYINDGNLVPDEVTIDMLKAEVEKKRKTNGFIFDGFPRTLSQAKALDRFLQEKNIFINAMIALEVPENILVERLLKRGEISNRVDDQDESKIRNRFNEYHSKTDILRNYYQNQDKYYGINGVGTIENVAKLITEVFEQL